MCVVSMVGGHFDDKFRRDWPTFIPAATPEVPPVAGFPSNIVSRAEFEALRREVIEMKELLKKAVEYDRSTGQPDCQNEDKIKLLRAVAAAVGIDLDEVFK